MSDSCSVQSLNSNAGTKRKRTCLSIATKLQIVERVENGESISKLAAEYNIGNQTVRDMIRKKEKLHRFVISCNTLDVAGGRKTVKGSKFDDLDKAVFEWFKQERAKGCLITGPVLLEKAKCLHNELKIPAPFAASQGWLHCFKTRHGIRQWDIQGDSSTASLHVTEFNKLIGRQDLTFDQLYSVSDTAVYWKALPPKTLTSQPGLGQKPSNERIRVLACSNASGSHKLKLVCVGKSKKPRSFRGTKMCHFPVVYYGQHKAQMTWDVLTQWFFKHFVPEVREHLRSKNQSQRAVLFVGQAHNYTEENAPKTSDGQIYVTYLHPHGAHLKQPMDICLHEFKRRYRKSLLRSFLEENARRKEFGVSWTVKDAVLSCLKCWEELPASVIRKSWSSLFPDARKSIKVEEGSGEIEEVTATSPWDGPRPVRGFEDVKEEDIEEWFLAGNDENGDDDEEPEIKIMGGVTAIKEELPEENYDQVERGETRVSATEALKCVETLLEFLRQERGLYFTQILTLRELRKSLTNKPCEEDTGQQPLSDFYQGKHLNKT